MEHFSGADAGARLLGPPVGTVGHRVGGVLTQQLRRRQRCMLVLQNISCAHAAAMQILLRLLRHGSIDAGNAELDCRHVTVVATDASEGMAGVQTKLNRALCIWSGIKVVGMLSSPWPLQYVYLQCLHRHGDAVAACLVPIMLNVEKQDIDMLAYVLLQAAQWLR